jgi:hydroxypyruvate reductase
VALTCTEPPHQATHWTGRAALIAAIGSSVCAIVTGGAHGASNEIVDALPRLEIIAINGIGTDAVDLERARARSVRVTTTPDVLTEDVADLALGLMLATSRRICVADRFVRTGGWLHEHLPLAAKMSGKRLGILGLGHVGRAVARRAEGFGMRITYCDRHPVAGAAYRFQPDLEQLAKDSDFLVVAASGGSATRGVVSRPVLNALGSAGVLSRAVASSTSPRWLPRSPRGFRAGQVWTYLRTSGTFRGRSDMDKCRAPAASGERDGRDAPGHGRPRPRQSCGPFLPDENW